MAPRGRSLLGPLAVSCALMSCNASSDGGEPSTVDENGGGQGATGGGGTNGTFGAKDAGANAGGAARDASSTGAKDAAGGANAGGAAAAGGATGRGGATGTGGDTTLGDAGPPPPESPFDWVGVVGTGQSLSTGLQGNVISTTQPFHNLKLVDRGPDPKYPLDDSDLSRWGVIPLTERIREPVPGTGPGYSDNQYPNNIDSNLAFGGGETPHSGMANTLSMLFASRGDYVSAHTVVGVGGTALVGIAKGTRSYNAALNEARVFTRLASAEGKTYGVAGIVLTHGESDADNPTYGADLYAFYRDYNADLKTATGQTRDVVLFGSQQSSFADDYDGSAVQLWRAGRDHPGQIVCTGPKYQYFHIGGLHLPGAGYERMGEKYAEVFDQVVNRSVPWKPLGPTRASRSGAVITIDFDVPNPPLVWDAHLTAPHQSAHTAWSKGRGFEVIDGAGGEVPIASAEIQGTSVVLTLAQTPALGTSLRVAYAVAQDGTGRQGGTELGPHGQLRDSDEFVGWDAETIRVSLSNGSTYVMAGAGLLARRASGDIVEGAGVPPGVVVDAVFGDTLLGLTAPWSGASGEQSLTLHHDLRNYCVHFAMTVP